MFIWANKLQPCPRHVCAMLPNVTYFRHYFRHAVHPEIGPLREMPAEFCRVFDRTLQNKLKTPTEPICYVIRSVCCAMEAPPFWRYIPLNPCRSNVRVPVYSLPPSDFWEYFRRVVKRPRNQADRR